jgi:hypothetical protein
VGDTIDFSGHASDPEDGAIAPSGLRWSVIMNHCSPLGGCHQHQIQDFVGVEGGSFVAPDHEYPSYLELRLTATDASGLEDTQSRRLDPQTVNLTFASSPAGLQLVHGSAAATAPFTRTVIIGSTNTMSAPSPQTLGSATHQFQSWSDGGGRTHTIVAGATSTIYTATFAGPPLPVPAAPTGLTAARAGSTRIKLAWGNVANETGYRIERSVGGGAFAQVGTTGANVVSFTNTGLSANTIYVYRVKAFNASGNSAPSSTAQAKTLPAVIRINFQPAGVPVPSGYLVDAGAAYANRGNSFSYGWNAANAQTRDRNSSLSPDQRFDTLNHMQLNGTFSWNLGLPNGTYQVRLVAGDAQSSANYFRIKVESVLAINQRQTSSSRWADRTVTVTVSDGKLTISNATGSSGNKICFVDVTPQQ